MDTGFNIFEAQPHLAGQPPVDLTAAPPTAAPPRRRRRALLASAAVLAVAAAGGAFLLSPYNHVVPIDTGRLGAQVRQLAASVASGAPETPVVAPAARLATAPRPQAKRPSRGETAPADPDAQMRELLALRSGADKSPADVAPGAAGQEAGQPEEASSPPPPSPALPPAASAVPVGAGVGISPVARPAAPVLPAAAPPPPDGTTAMEPGMPPPASQAAASGPAAPASPPVAPAPVETTSKANASVPADARSQEPAVSGVAPQAASAPASNPAPTATAGDAAGAAPAPPQPDAVATAIALRPGPMSRGEQIDVLHLVGRLGIAVRDLRTENAALRADVKASSDKVDNAVADFERRLALAEGRSAVNAAMGDADASSEAPAALASSAPSTSRTIRLVRAPAPQPVSLQTQAAASAGLSSGPHRYKVQAASPSLAMLSELDRSGGEGSQLQVGVGDPVPGFGRVSAIQQQGMAWVVKTDRGTIQ